MNKINAVYVSLVALVVAVIALVMCILCCSCKKGGADVEAVLKEKPELVMQAMQAYDAKQREEALKQVEEKIKATKWFWLNSLISLAAIATEFIRL